MRRMEYQKFNFLEISLQINLVVENAEDDSSPTFYLNTSAVDPAVLPATSNTSPVAVIFSPLVQTLRFSFRVPF